ncbi:Cys/Met metabolism, pyridoxal phosphate-dependent enzyme, partial [mine drainage metagenome]
SLVSVPPETSHRGFDEAERARLGIGDGLVRLSLGIEDPADLVRDLNEALDGLPGGAADGTYRPIRQ